MPDRFDKFVHDENILRLTKQIAAEADPARLIVLAALLKEEEAKSQPLPRPRQ